MDYKEIGLTGVEFCMEEWPIDHGRVAYSIFTIIFQYLMPVAIVSFAYLGKCAFIICCRCIELLYGYRLRKFNYSILSGTLGKIMVSIFTGYPFICGCNLRKFEKYYCFQAKTTGRSLISPSYKVSERERANFSLVYINQNYKPNVFFSS